VLGYESKLLLNPLLKRNIFLRVIKNYQSKFNKLSFIPLHKGNLPVVPTVSNKTQLYEDFIMPLVFQLYPDLLISIKIRIKADYKNKIISKSQYYKLNNQLIKSTAVRVGGEHDLKAELERKINVKSKFLKAISRIEGYRKNTLNTTVS
jgi:hypothetical protein